MRRIIRWISRVFRLGQQKNIALWQFKRFKEAVLSQDLISVDLLIEQNYAYRDQQDTIFHFAIRNKKNQVLKFIHSYLSFDPNQLRNGQQDTLIHQAVYSNNLEILQDLHRKSEFKDLKLQINAREVEGNTAVIAAACIGDIQIFRFLVQEMKADLSLYNYDNQSALHKACFYGHFSVVKYLLENSNLKITSCDVRGNNCFHMAAAKLNLGCLRYLLSRTGTKDSIMQKENVHKRSPLNIIHQILNQLRSSDQQIEMEKVSELVLAKGEELQTVQDWMCSLFMQGQKQKIQ